MSLSRRRIRLALDTTSFDQPKDVNTGSTPALWRGNAIQVEFAIFVKAALLTDLSNISSVVLEVKATRHATENLIAPTTLANGDLNDSLTLSEWAAGTLAHGTFTMTGAETNLDLAGADYKDFWLVISVVTAEPEPITLGASTIRIYEDGAGFDADDPPVNPGAALTLGSAANLFPQVWSTITGLTGGTSEKLDSIPQADMSHGKVIMLPLAGDALFWRAMRRSIVSSSAANPTTVTTTDDHNLTTGDVVAIGGHSLAGVNGATVTVTVTGAKTFTIAVLGGGTGGYATQAENAALGIVRPDDFSASNGLHWRSVGG